MIYDDFQEAMQKFIDATVEGIANQDQLDAMREEWTLLKTAVDSGFSLRDRETALAQDELRRKLCDLDHFRVKYKDCRNAYLAEELANKKLKRELEVLKEDHKHLHARFDEKDRTVARLRDELEKERDRLQDEKDHIDDRFKEMSEEYDELQEELNNKKKAYDTLNREHKEMCDALKKEREDYIDRIATLEKDESLNAVVDRLSSKLIAQGIELSNCRAKLENARDYRAKLEMRIKDTIKMVEQSRDHAREAKEAAASARRIAMGAEIQANIAIGNLRTKD